MRTTSWMRARWEVWASSCYDSRESYLIMYRMYRMYRTYRMYRRYTERKT